MTGMVQTDLAPPPAAKYKEEPAEDSVSIFLCHGLGFIQGLPSCTAMVIGEEYNLAQDILP